jgi:uncharacterized protein (DUF2147 family)
VKKAKFAFLITALFMFAAQTVFADDFSTVIGKWKTKDDATGEFKSVVEFYIAKDGSLEGKIAKLIVKDKGVTCETCPGESNFPKGTPLEGMIIAKGIKKIGEKSGTIFDPEKAKNYTVKVWREGKNLMVRGHIAFFYRTQTWYPAE